MTSEAARIDWTQVHRLMFVCLGNICRSPMAACLASHLLKQSGCTDITVASAATSREEYGNPIHPGALSELRRHNIPIIPHRAIQLTAADLGKYDLFLGMDSRNVSNMRRILGPGADGCCFRLLDLSDFPRDIADPWFTGNFDETWHDLQEGCGILLRKLLGHDI